MAGLFSRLKIWNPGEDLTASDLNAEFNHFLSNIDALHSEGYSANLSQMQQTEDPGDLGSENLTQPISLAQEIERLRYTVNRIVGKSYWYQAPSDSLEGLTNTINGYFILNPSRIVDGEKSTISGFPKFLQANGASGVRLNASAGVPFDCFIDNAAFTFTSNITASGLSAQPTNNTALLASSLGGGQASREATEFTISSVGSSIISSIGRPCIFSIVNGGNTEYFLGTVKDSSTITGIKRGYFFDTSNIPVPAIALTTGHTITLLKTTWVFLKTDGTLSVSYNPPIYNDTAPSSPAINDYWYDMEAQTWKIYTGIWAQANALLLGICAQGPANTVCARSEHFFENFESTNTLKFEQVTNTTVSTVTSEPSNISVYGSLVKSDFKPYFWDITVNLFPGETETSSTTYYFYLTQIGKPYISSTKPIEELGLYGWYHPYEAMRCVGYVLNNGSSNFDNFSTQFLNFDFPKQSAVPNGALVPTGTVLSFAGATAPSGYLSCDGSAISRSIYSDLFYIIGTSHGNGDGSTTFNLPDYRYSFLRGLGSTISVTGSGSAASNQATFTNHGIIRTGMRVRLSSGTLSGLATSTNYFAIVVDANTLAFASSYANAIGNSRIAISGANSAVIVQWEDPVDGSNPRLQAAVGGNTTGLGTRQDDQFLSHTHAWTGQGRAGVGGDVNFFQYGSAGGVNNGNMVATNANTGTLQTTPRNVYVNYIIKT